MRFVGREGAEEADALRRPTPRGKSVVPGIFTSGPDYFPGWISILFSLGLALGIVHHLPCIDGAVDTLLAVAGVCRDFAQLVVALLRAVNVPARVVSAYAPGLDSVSTPLPRRTSTASGE